MFNQTSRPENEAAQEGTVMVEERQPENSPETQAAPPEAEALLGENEEWQNKYQLLQDQFTRLAADFDNYRKRVREEQESLVKYGAQKSVLELLPVLDNLERAAGSLNENSDPKTLFKSFGVMQKQLMDGLESLGVKKIQAVGQPFDPQYHEAINRMESAEFPENTVMFEAQSGYQLHDKVIRPAMVVVSTGGPDVAADASSPAEEDRDNPFRK